MNSFILRHARTTFAVVGALLGLGAPAGWLVLTWALGLTGDTSAASHQQALLAYLTVGTVGAFTIFGVAMGNMYERVRELATRDDLTNLFNQRAFLQTAEFLLQLGIRHNEPIAFMMMDIDHFKDVNDNHNHLVGSHVLKEIAKILGVSLRKSDLTARFGGDEYVFCLPRTPPRNAAEVADRIRRSIESTVFSYRGHTLKVTVSIGVAAATCAPRLELNRLLELADQALYAAKDQGRNRVVVQALDDTARPSQTPVRLGA